MKARPRSVECKVAAALTDLFGQMGASPVERIPVLGRTGPDISINEMQMVIDVKSRIGIPKSIFFPLLIPFRFDDFIGVRLEALPALWDEECNTAPLDFSSKVIRDYWAHMDEWRVEKCPQGVSAIILHRPEMPIGSCVVTIHKHDRRRLLDYAEQCYTNQRTTEYQRDYPLSSE